MLDIVSIGELLRQRPADRAGQVECLPARVPQAPRLAQGVPALGSVLSGPRGMFICPAYPLRKVVDPTGAGDSFVGGMMGYLAAAKGPIDAHIRRAMTYGSVVASFCCEGFGVQRTTKITRAQIDGRVKELERLTRF